MAAESAITLVKFRLENLLKEHENVHPALRRQVDEAVGELKSRRLMDDAGIQQQMSTLLPTLYQVGDNIDFYLVRRMLQKQHNRHVCQFEWCSASYSNEMKELVDDIGKLCQNLSRIGDTTPQIEDQGLDRVSVYVEEEESDIVSQGGDVKKLEKLILGEDDLDPIVIPVVIRAEGFGETDLVRYFYNRTDVKQQFEHRAWFRIPKECMFRDMLIDIINQIRKTWLNDAEIMEEGDLIEMLYMLLMKRSYLVVLEDVSTIDETWWEKFTASFPDLGKGSRIILITRDLEVPKLPHPWSPPVFQLSPLTDEESWVLFKKKVRKSETEIIDLKEQILRKCNNLPLSVLLLGGLLSAMEINQRPSVTIGPNNLSDVMDLSYHSLPSKLKPCFLYMGMFPKDFEIPIRRLLHLWIADGLVLLDESIRPEDMAEIYFKQLSARHMIAVSKWRLDGSPKTCRMPGDLYNYFVPKATEMGFFHLRHQPEDSSSQFPPSDIRRLAEYIEFNSNASSDHYQQLHSYISFQRQTRNSAAQEISTFLNTIVTKRGFGLLRVLDLEGVYKPVLSETLGKLLLLRYLGLRWTTSDSLPASIGNLPFLETLDVKHTKLTFLPNSVCKAKNLRHLYLNEIYFDTKNEKTFKWSFTNLQTLWGLSLVDGVSIGGDLNSVISIKKLGVTYNFKSAKAVAEWISKLTDLKSLWLRSIDVFGRPSDLNIGSINQHQTLTDLYLIGALPKQQGSEALINLFPNLKTLTLSFAGLSDDPMKNLGQLPHLYTLRFMARSYMGEEMVCEANSFPALRVLKIWSLDKLKSFTVKEGAFPKLREMEIRRCSNLEKAEGMEKLKELKELSLTTMGEGLVEDVRGRMGSHVYVAVNNWEFSQPRD